jgi:AbrB family looped-hinge helix DNA binding protein
MGTATVGARFQVVIPLAERKKIGLRAHDKVAVTAARDAIVIRPLKAAVLRGIGKDLADSRDAVAYVRELRAEWGTRT